MTSCTSRPAHVEQLRDTGRSDAEIAILIEQASGHTLSPDERHDHKG